MSDAVTGIEHARVLSRLEKLEECAAVLREIDRWRTDAPMKVWERAEQALAALDKEPKDE
jgi:hypothetical protein